MPKRSVNILDVAIDKENFPVMYQWAEENPKYLEEILKSMMEKDGSTATACLITLETDMQTDES